MAERFRPPPPPKIRNVTFYQMDMGQQAAAIKLCAAHARNVEFVPPREYARYVLHWQLSEAGEVVGWISGHPATSKET